MASEVQGAERRRRLVAAFPFLVLLVLLVVAWVASLTTDRGTEAVQVCTSGSNGRCVDVAPSEVTAQPEVTIDEPAEPAPAPDPADLSAAASTSDQATVPPGDATETVPSQTATASPRPTPTPRVETEGVPPDDAADPTAPTHADTDSTPTGTPAPRPALTPTATATATPAATPTVTYSDLTPTPEVEASATATATATAAATSQATATPQPTATPRPTATPIPPTATPIPVPTATPTATATPVPAGPQPFGVAGSWTLLFEDNFDYLDTSKWETAWFSSFDYTPSVNGSGGACFHPDQVAVYSGELALRIDPNDDPRCRLKNGDQADYVGALVNTRETFTFSYGYAEARIYLPSNGSGLINWPAFWHTGFDWPRTGEVDIVEGLSGGQPCSVYHYADSAGTHQQTKSCTNWESAAGWHIFAADWQPGRITYYIDGVPVFETTQAVVGDPHYLIFDYTVRSNGEDTSVPATMLVDYVRVFAAN